MIRFGLPEMAWGSNRDGFRMKYQKDSFMLKPSYDFLLDCADTSLPVSVCVYLSVSDNGVSEPISLPFEVSGHLRYDVTLLLKKMAPDLVLNGYVDTVAGADLIRTADFSASGTALLPNLDELMRYRASERFSTPVEIRPFVDWLKTAGWPEIKEEKYEVCFFIPLRGGEQKNTYVIHFRRLSGTDERIYDLELADVISYLRNLRNYPVRMLCVEENGSRILRWDRELCIDSPRWRACCVDDVEITGPLPVIKRLNTRKKR